MARNEKQGRKTTRTRFKVDKNQAEMFLYGKLSRKCKARAYCDLHKCYLDNENLSEKRCFQKHCKYLKEVN